MLNRDWIAAHIPHQGSMCLLHSVLEWDDQRIVCEATGHVAPEHPLRAQGRLGAAVGVEYAAQAMAVHGALRVSDEKPIRQGYLTSVRGLKLYVDRLDNLSGPIRVSAQWLSGDARLVLYQFELEHDGMCLMAGRASVVMDAQAL
ncbi:MAG: hydroxymyristoyl-ACP dehydratase [Burkholderiaceae bacterium]